MTKQAEISLPYFKQGDDLSGHLQAGLSITAALQGHSDQLQAAVEQLQTVKRIIEAFHEQGFTDVELHADTHYIGISADDEIIDALVEADVADIPEWLEEDDDCYDNEDESEDEE